MKLQALIFDVDGTLAETEELHRQSFNLTFQQFKLDWNWSPELYAELLQTTGGKERMVTFVEEHRPVRPDSRMSPMPQSYPIPEEMRISPPAPLPSELSAAIAPPAHASVPAPPPSVRPGPVSTRVPATGNVRCFYQIATG